MVLVLTSVYDQAAAAFGRVVCTASIGLAVRGFSDEINRSSPDNVMAAHAADFSLFHLGEFDDSNGRFKLLDVPLRIAAGSDVVVSLH